MKHYIQELIYLFKPEDSDNDPLKAKKPLRNRHISVSVKKVWGLKTHS